MMNFSHISVGGGMVGVETIICAINNIESILKKTKKKIFFNNKKITFAIIDSNPENIPGGVAYGFKSSQYGYFNNPIRLAPLKLKKWISIKKNQNKIIFYLQKYGSLSGRAWLKKNLGLLKKTNTKSFDEIYFPRVLANLWMEEKIFLLLKKINYLNRKFSIEINLKFIKGEVISASKQNNGYTKISFRNNKFELLNYKLNRKKIKSLQLIRKQIIHGNIYSYTQSISLGLPPPIELADTKTLNHINYIRDFYASGGTANLIKKLLQIFKKKKNKVIKIYFIGYKAGLLEPLSELKYLINDKQIPIQMICSSSDLLGIEKAEKTFGNKKYNLKFFKSHTIKKINTASKLFNNIISEFNIAVKNNYNKYDAWTEILNKNILGKCLFNFKSSEIKLYKNSIFYKIRAVTRFTYPSTIQSRDELISNGLLIAKKEKVIKVSNIKNKLFVNVKNNKNKFGKFFCDLIVNVSGPMLANNLKKEWPVVQSIKNRRVILTPGGFEVNNNFSVIGNHNIYIPGFLANSFNPERKTIIKAILENSEKAGKDIAKKLLMIYVK